MPAAALLTNSKMTTVGWSATVRSIKASGIVVPAAVPRGLVTPVAVAVEGGATAAATVGVVPGRGAALNERGRRKVRGRP